MDMKGIILLEYGSRSVPGLRKLISHDISKTILGILKDVIFFAILGCLHVDLVSVLAKLVINEVILNGLGH
jgi:hypothetical protein